MKDPKFQDRASASADAKKAMLERFKARPGPDDPAVLARKAERAAIQAAREVRQAERERLRREEEARREAERIAAEKAEQERKEREELERMGARDRARGRPQGGARRPVRGAQGGQAPE